MRTARLAARLRGAAGALAALALVLAPSSSEGGAGAATPAVTATGSVSCTLVTGTISYRPALHHVGTVPALVTVALRASRCTTARSNVARVTRGTLTQSIHLATNSCRAALSVVAGTVRATGTWSAPAATLRPTSATFSGLGFVERSNGTLGMVLPDPTGTAKATGSFAGRDHGAATSAVGYVALTTAQILRACTSSAGLASLRVSSGRLRVG